MHYSPRRASFAVLQFEKIILTALMGAPGLARNKTSIQQYSTANSRASSIITNNTVTYYGVSGDSIGHYKRKQSRQQSHPTQFRAD